MMEKYHILQPKPKTTDDSKVALQIIGRAATTTHQQGGNELQQVLAAYMAVAANGERICSNSVHLQVCIFISSPTNQLLSQSPTDW